jgi:hypothetical protein
MNASDRTFLDSPGLRFGSLDSRDVDVLFPVNSLPDPQRCKQLCSQAGENRNLFVVQDGVVAETYKGLPDETNNSLLATYHLHPQQVELPIQQMVLRNVPLKVVRATRVVLSLLTRSAYREEVKSALRSENLEQRHQVLGKIDFTRLELDADSAKSISFQLSQAIALIDGTELYTKAELQAAFPAVADMIARRPVSLVPLNVLRDAYLEKLAGVYVRQKGSLNLLMYGNALAIKEWNQYARQSRGMVLDVARERCVFFPMDKFFRFGEGPEITRQQLAEDAAVEVVEKVDGSMVSLVTHEGERFFSCKGNFDTEQSARAGRIASRLPLDQLRTDRFNHVFEVVYPENRFPAGLSIVDYGTREDLVLIAMRDRYTNRLLSYAELIREAQRVGISHPKVFSGTLAEVFAKVDQDRGDLGNEGYVIRQSDTGRYFKLKYDGYKEVLRIVNEIRSDRFIREYYAMTREQRAQTLARLPSDIRVVAESQIEKLEAIISDLQSYAESVAAMAQDDPREFAKHVRETVPEGHQRLVFQISRGLPARELLERAAVELYRTQQAARNETELESDGD